MHKILLVEDNEINREMLTRRLEVTGFLLHQPGQVQKVCVMRRLGQQSSPERRGCPGRFPNATCC